MFSCTVETNGEAFKEDLIGELRHILEQTLKGVEAGIHKGVILDSKSGLIGNYTLTLGERNDH